MALSLIAAGVFLVTFFLANKLKRPLRRAISYSCRGMAKLFKNAVMKWIDDKRSGRKRHDSNSSNDTSETKSSTICDSNECIRCSKNLEIVSTALTKLSYYMPSFHDDAASSCSESGSSEGYKNLIDDVKLSFERLKKEKENLENPSHLLDDDDLQLIPRQSRILSAPVVFYMSSLEEKCFWNVKLFKDVSLLLDKWRQVALECQHLYQSPLEETKSLWKVNSTDNGKWEIAQLIDQGRMTKVAEFCPLTINIIKQLPNFVSGCFFGDASFSIIHPGTHIATHTGSTNCRIRCHIGLKLPSKVCKLTVGAEQRCWAEGEALCFDDSIPHSVDHTGQPGSGSRAVLMVDLWHPGLTAAQRDMVSYAFSP